MKHGFLVIAAAVVFLFAFAEPRPAVAGDPHWQDLVNQYGELAKSDDAEKALKVATQAMLLAEFSPNRDEKQLAISLYILAGAHAKLGNWDKALPQLERLLAISEKIYGPEHPDTALTLYSIASAYHSLAQHDEAINFNLRALAIREKVLGPEHLDTADSLNNLASIYRDLAQHDKALPLQERALAIREKALGPEHPETAASINNLAGTYADIAQYHNALPLQMRALAIREKALGPEHPDTAQSLDNLAAIYGDLAQHKKALPLQQRALAIREKLFGAEHPYTALSLNNLAVTYAELAQFDRTLPLQHRVLAIREKTLRPEHPDIATALNNLASTYGKLGQYSKALPLQQRALLIREKSLGPMHPDTGQSLNNLADTYVDLAMYHEALPLQMRTLAIHEQILGKEHPRTASILGNLAGIYSKLGEYDKALPLKQRTLDICKKIFGPEHLETAKSLSNLAYTYTDLAEYQLALPLQQRSLEIIEKALGQEHPDTATTLNNLADIYSRLGQHEKALPLQQRALVIREKAFGLEHPTISTSLGNLAETYIDLDLSDKALPLQQRALAINEHIFGPEHPRTATSLNNLGHTFNKIGQPELAIAVFKLAVNAHQIQRERVALIDTQALLSYTASVAYVYQSLADLLVAQGLLSDAQLVLDMLKENEQFEFIRRNSSADPRLTRIGYNANEQVWMTRYRQIADRLAALGAEEQALQKQAKLGLNAAQKQRQKEVAADLLVAKTAFESFLKEMQESFSRQGTTKKAEVSETSREALRELQGLIKNIGPDVVLLQYYITDDKVGMLLTTPGTQLARSNNLSAKELNRKIAEFRRVLRDPKSDAKKSAHELYKLLVEPVAGDLEQAGAKTVMLSLDGALRYLPFSALHDGQRYLIQRWNLPLYTSVTKKKLLDASATQWQGAGLGVTKAVGQFNPLPAVKAEMRSIFKVDGNGVLPGEVYLDEAFTAQRFKDVSQRPFQLLHVASHFQFSPGTEINSFLLLGDGQQLTLGDIRTQNFRFDNLDLLTLSACDTGLGGGRDAQGREIEGFGVIAQQQGAKAVLATLWPVADESTSKLMAEMYRRRQEQQQTKIESLRQAQLSLLSQSHYEHPFYWAPFILMGNWK